MTEKKRGRPVTKLQSNKKLTDSKRAQPMPGGLTLEQCQLAGYLAQGYSTQAAAEMIGVSLASANRWKAKKSFRELHDKLAEAHTAALTNTLFTSTQDRGAALAREMTAYQEKRTLLATQQIDAISNLMDKILDKIGTLEAKDIGVNQIGYLLTAISSVSEKAFVGWSDVVGIKELQRQMQALSENHESVDVEEVEPPMLEAEDVTEVDEVESVAEEE